MKGRRLVIDRENPFMGCNIAVTGKLENFTRNEINERIAMLGGTPKSTVTGTTDYLICGRRSGGKLEKARNLGTRILSEQEFLDMAALL